MAPSTKAIDIRNVMDADEQRPFDKGEIRIVNVHGREIAWARMEPGWTWHDCVKPLAGTESCEFQHFFYVISGGMRVVMDDGTEATVRAGDVAAIAPGHHAEVVGDEPFVSIDLAEDDINYALPKD
jgi:mannose-6-phosphate isomerase-like protein (cupin superfamily)